ncbi:MAG: Na+/H+ antiporter NhaC family protein [Planctomycetes bacterium]|nr:Na+/H+ antiporter NhaC family protein [Planctomycetota bacterium]
MKGRIRYGIVLITASLFVFALVLKSSAQDERESDNESEHALEELFPEHNDHSGGREFKVEFLREGEPYEGLYLRGVTEVTLRVTATRPTGEIDALYSTPAEVSGILVPAEEAPGEESKITSAAFVPPPVASIEFVRGILEIEKVRLSGEPVTFSSEGFGETASVVVIDPWLSLIPPLLALLLALVFKEVVVALFSGILSGVVILIASATASSRWYIVPFEALMRSIDTYILGSLTDSDSMKIIVFSMLLGGMVGIITRSGGTHGIVEVLSRYAKGRKSGQIATWLMGIFIFFDDYANTLIVGNTMRSYTDKLKISREKLAYIVDSTSAPVAGLALISTWIGYEVSQISENLPANFSGVDGLNVTSAYQLFLYSIPYRFYSIFTLVFVFLIAATGRDFFSMRKAEQRAAVEGKLLRDGAIPLSDTDFEDMKIGEGKPKRWINAFLPVVVVIGVCIGAIYQTGYDGLSATWEGDPTSKSSYDAQPWYQQLGDVFGNGDAYAALLWGSFAGCIVAGFLAISQQLCSVRETMESWFRGVKSMTLAAVILTLAWTLAGLCKDVQTGTYVVSLTIQSIIPELLPAIMFVVAGVIAFATGTSYGTMAILFPIATPLAIEAAEMTSYGPDAASGILLGTVAAVLAGSCFGDHASPISDTTVMSSMASGSDHLDHVRTQAPYAIVTALIALGAGFIPVGYGISPWTCLGIGLWVLLVPIFLFGRKVKYPAKGIEPSE